MNLKELRKLVIETVKEEQVKTKTRNFASLVETTVNLVLEGEEDNRKNQTPSSGAFHQWVKDGVALSDVDMEKAAEAEQIDDPKPEDAVQVDSSQSPHTCQELSPTQSSMNIQKAVHFALGMLNGTMYPDGGGPGGDTGAFICDNYLLDGHHRWIATCLVAPGANINGYDMTGVTAEEAVMVLNAATGSLMGHNKGKEGSGSFKVFHSAEEILKMLKLHDEATAQKSGVPMTPGSGHVTKICEKWAAGEYNHSGMTISKADEPLEGEEARAPLTGERALKWAAESMVTNAKSCPGVSDSAVLLSQTRVDMPVADDLEHASEVGGKPVVSGTPEVIDAISKGGIDLKESIDLARWNKLAGILKD